MDTIKFYIDDQEQEIFTWWTDDYTQFHQEEFIHDFLKDLAYYISADGYSRCWIQTHDGRQIQKHVFIEHRSKYFYCYVCHTVEGKKLLSTFGRMVEL